MSMNKELSIIGIALSILLIATSTSSAIAQNLTTNASNAAGKSVNQTTAVPAQNMSNIAGNGSQTMSKPTENATNAVNKTGEPINATTQGPSNNVSDKTTKIGSAQQLSELLGNNSQILANNTPIGNPNMSLTEKMSAESNATKNQTGNISGAMSNVTNSANATMSEIGKNLTEGGGSLLNKTGEVAKKIVSGAASVLGNISGEIQQGIGGK